MTGEHAERAGETALAIDCFEQAGEDAQKRFANTAAVSWLRRAVNLLRRSGTPCSLSSWPSAAAPLRRPRWRKPIWPGCRWRATALAMVDRLLDRLSGELASHPAHDTIGLRWTCHQVLSAAADARAEDLLARVAADRERLIQAIPVFRAVVAEHGRRGEPTAPR